jgi:opacity protein-like surface antigen
MKKLIVLSVIFALVAGGVFAADVGVEVHGKATLIQNSTAEHPDGMSGDTPKYALDYNTDAFAIGRVRFGVSGETEDGTIGGWGRIQAGSYGGGVVGWGFVWWKPIDAVKLQIGSNAGDGEFGLEGVTGWGFYALANETITPNGNTWGGGVIGAKFRDAFFGGWNAPGIILNITPTEAFAINIGIPLSTSTWAWEDYAKLTLQAAFNIDGVGTAGLTFVGDTMKDEGAFSPTTEKTKVPNMFDSDGNPIYLEGPKAGGGEFLGSNNDNPTMFVYFGLSAIENMGIDIGIGYKFADTYAYEVDTVVAGTKYTNTTTITNNNPLAVGLGFSFSSDAFGIKARLLGEFGGSYVYEEKSTVPLFKGDSYTLGTGLSVVLDVLPYFAISDNFTFYLSAGFGTYTKWDYIDAEATAKATDGKSVVTTTDSAQFGWHVQPFICITPSYWSGAFFAGIRIESPTDKYPTVDSKGVITNNRFINWSVPIGITASF